MEEEREGDEGIGGRWGAGEGMKELGVWTRSGRGASEMWLSCEVSIG